MSPTGTERTFRDGPLCGRYQGQSGRRSTGPKMARLTHMRHRRERVLSLSVPDSMQLLADEVIE